MTGRSEKAEGNSGVAPPGISGAILAGGQSRRFGSDKAFMPSPVDGRPLLLATIECLRGLVDDLAVIAPPDRGYERFGADVRTERSPGRGPLGGIEMALASARHDRCLIVACDLPLLNRGVLAWMAALPFEGDALVPLVAVSGDEANERRPQSLHAIYRRSCLPALRDLLDDGERRVSRLLDAIRVVHPAADELLAIDPGLASFVNMNTTSDWLSAAGTTDA